MMRRTPFALALLAMSACAMRLGGPSPFPVQVAALRAGANESADAIAERIRSAGAEFALITAARDSAWFASVATATGLELSGPGTTGPGAMGFLSGKRILGDTSIVLIVPSGGSIHMHDALFEIEEDRNIDLMFIEVVDVINLQDGVRTLLSYIATDVGNNVPLILGVTSPAAGIDARVTEMIRAAFANAGDCVDNGTTVSVATERLSLLYGPPALVRCENVNTLPGDAGVSARLIVGR